MGRDRPVREGRHVGQGGSEARQAAGSGMNGSVPPAANRESGVRSPMEHNNIALYSFYFRDRSAGDCPPAAQLIGWFIVYINKRWRDPPPEATSGGGRVLPIT